MEPKKHSQKSNKGRKPKKDLNAPKQPVSGYIRFMNEKRESIRSSNPTAKFADVAKMLAYEWSQLPSEEKQTYLAAAELDKERYIQELKKYKQTEAYRTFHQKRAEKKGKGAEKDDGSFDIPIFTEEFLDHNKVREAELRQLRKITTEYEEQNAILQKHVESMKAAVERLELESLQLKSSNDSLQKHLDQLKDRLSACFSELPLPGSTEAPSFETIESYILKVHQLVSETTDNENEFLSLVKEKLRNVDLSLM